MKAVVYTAWKNQRTFLTCWGKGKLPFYSITFLSVLCIIPFQPNKLGIEPTTFRLVAQCLRQLLHRVLLVAQVHVRNSTDCATNRPSTTTNNNSLSATSFTPSRILHFEKNCLSALFATLWRSLGFITQVLGQAVAAQYCRTRRGQLQAPVVLRDILFTV
jgi:hypothetical protein